MRLLLVVFTLFMSLPALAAQEAQPVVQQAEATQDADLAKVQTQVETVDRELVILKQVTDNRLDTQDQRIGDLSSMTEQQGNYMSAIANVTTWVGAGIALLAILAGFVNFISVRNQASARATEIAEQWFQKNADTLQNQAAESTKKANSLHEQVTALRLKADETYAEIERIKVEFSDHANKSRMTIDQATEQILTAADAGRNKRIINPAAIEAVAQANREIDDKPASSFSADDHFARGLREYLSSDFKSALSSFDNALQRTQIERSQPENIAKFLLFRGVTLGELGRLDDAIAANDEIVNLYGNDTTPSMRTQVVKAQFNKGVSLGRLERIDEAISVYDSINQQYGKDKDPIIRAQVATALFNKAFALGQQKHYAEAITVYDAVDRLYSVDPDMSLRVQVSEALVNKGYVLGQINKSAEAISVYDAIDRRYGTDPDPILRARVATALVNKGLALSRLNRTAEEIAAYDTVDLRYSSDPDPSLNAQVGKALNGRAYVRIMLAKQHWDLEAERRERLVQAIGDLQRAQSKSTSNDQAMVLGNLGYALHLGGAGEEAEQYTRECLRLGQEIALKAQREDARVHRVEPQDTEYEQLLEQLWQKISSQA